MRESSASGTEELLIRMGTPAGNGLARLQEILQCPAAVDAGFKPKPASFQRVMVPLMLLLTQKELTQSTLREVRGR